MKRKIYAIASLATVTVLTLTSCNLFKKKKNDPAVDFDFTVALESGKTTLEIGDTDTIKCTSNLTEDSVTRSYTFEVSNTSRMTVDDSGFVTAVGTGGVTIDVTETNSEVQKTLELNVIDPAPPASGGFNYSSSSGAEAIAKRTEILGKLEKYAIESHLTGISLFENGGYVKYRDRLDIPADEYITGYGFGILTEGDITADLATETVEAHKRYYHTVQTNDPNKINAWNDSGSQVSDLASYITSSYFGTKMNEYNNGYEWYPVLAKDKVNGVDYTRPTPVYNGEPVFSGDPNPLGLYKTWRIYVKTGDDGLKYRHSGSRGFDKRAVDLKDYASTFKLLLTGANKQSRGAELAANKTYGIKGAQAYYDRTRDQDDETIDSIWNTMTLTDNLGNQNPSNFANQQLGILVGEDSKGSYLQLEVLHEMDRFTAMYELSSNLYSPIPEEFVKALSSDGKMTSGILNFGQNSSEGGHDYSIRDNSICLGAYFLEDWNADYITFKQDDTWIERTTHPNRHKIKGVKILTYPNATQEAIYQWYYAGKLDSCGIPIDYIAEEAAEPDVRKTKGDSTFKLNVNSCTQERWNELDRELWKNPDNDKWDVKPWMSNENFLNGLYWSIDRKNFATSKGAQPSLEYFSSAYLTDPENGVSYNDSTAHKQAISKWHNVRTVGGVQVDDYGYDYDKAVECFKNAVSELASAGKIVYGTTTNPTEIHIHIRWMYSTDIADYGADIKQYFEKAFNDNEVSGGRVKLVVDQAAVTSWQDVYNVYMKKGKFDLAFGAISGNTYNPLNFLEVLKSDNSSGFTLNWGADTSKVDYKNPLIYDNHKWSFDALWEVADRGGVVDEGVSVKTVKRSYLDGLPSSIASGIKTPDFSCGVRGNAKLEFVELDGVDINVTKVQVYASGGQNHDVSFTYNKASKNLSYEISSELGTAIENEINKIVNKEKDPSDPLYVNDVFFRDKYGTYWTIEVYYTLSIAGGTPTESFVTLYVSEDAQP